MFRFGRLVLRWGRDYFFLWVQQMFGALFCFYFPFMAIMNVFWFVFIAFLELEVIWW
jgi:hypothetical protein